MDLGIEIRDAPDARSPFTPEGALELKAKARELFAQGFEYSSLVNERVRSAFRAKPVWE